jgi:DNA-binding NtrC family response regulator
MPVLCCSLKQARSLLAHESIRLVFCGDLPIDGSFRDMLQSISNSRSGLPLIVFSSLHDWKLHFEALQLGAFDCVGPSLRHKQIEGIVHLALLSAPARAATRS